MLKKELFYAVILVYVVFPCLKITDVGLSLSLSVSWSGCSGTWDKITCWPGADVGEVVTIPCPKYLFYFSRDIPTRKNQVYEIGCECVSE